MGALAGKGKGKRDPGQARNREESRGIRSWWGRVKKRLRSVDEAAKGSAAGFGGKELCPCEREEVGVTSEVWSWH